MPVKPKLNPHADAVIELYQSGKSLNDIAGQFGVCLATVYNFLVRKGVQLRSKSESGRVSWTEDRRAKASAALMGNTRNAGKKHRKPRKPCVSSRKAAYSKWRDPEYIKKYMQEYNATNREKLATNKREWFAQNHDKKLQIAKKYRDTHKASIIMAGKARRAKTKAGLFTVQDWEEMKAHYNYRCLCCGLSEPIIKLEIDHVVAVVNGGKHTGENIQPLCRSCNAKKHTKTIDYRK